jgi:hypothetical protein
MDIGGGWAFVGLVEGDGALEGAEVGGGADAHSNDYTQREGGGGLFHGVSPLKELPQCSAMEYPAGPVPDEERG